MLARIVLRDFLDRVEEPALVGEITDPPGRAAVEAKALLPRNAPFRLALGNLKFNVRALRTPFGSK